METTDLIMSNLYVIKFIAHVKEECKANKIHWVINQQSSIIVDEYILYDDGVLEKR